MRESEKAGSLFDLARCSKKEKGHGEKEAVVPPLPKVPDNYVLEENMEDVFKKFDKIHAEIKEKIEKAYDKDHISPREMEELMGNPKNFTSKEWEILQKMKKEYEDKLNQLKEKVPEKKEENEEKIKAKSGYITKKGWLSMH